MHNTQKIAYLPMCRIYPNRLTTYWTSEYGYKIHRKNKNSLNNLTNNKPNPNLSINAKKRIRTAVNWLFALSENKTVINPKTQKTYNFKINFITLTLSDKQVHSDCYIKKNMLNRFLEKIRYQYNLKSYLWKAESQQNGNIHFHITTNLYIPYNKIRDTWNQIQDKNGYLNKFFQKHGHKNPNSTDVHAVKKIKNLAAYMASYLTKNPTYRQIQGRQWYLSANLSKIAGHEEIIDNPVSSEIENLQKLKNTKAFHYDYSSVIYAEIFNVNKKQFPLIHKFVSLLKDKYTQVLN